MICQKCNKIFKIKKISENPFKINAKCPYCGYDFCKTLRKVVGYR